MLKVLVIDDDEQFFALLKCIFAKKRPDCSLTLCSDGNRIGSTLDLTQYDVVLCDYEMPLLKGNFVVQNIRKSNSNIKIIACSSVDANNHELIRLGANDSFNKTRLISDLSTLLNKININ